MMGALFALPGWTAFAIVASYIIVRIHEDDVRLHEASARYQQGKRLSRSAGVTLVVSLLLTLCVIVTLAVSGSVRANPKIEERFALIMLTGLVFGPLSAVNITAFFTRRQPGGEPDFPRWACVVCCVLAFLITAGVASFASLAWTSEGFEDSGD